MGALDPSSGIVNLLVGSTPLLSESSHAVILTSFIRESVLQKLYGSIDEFYETYLCMSSHAAAVLLGTHFFLSPCAFLSGGVIPGVFTSFHRML